MGRTTFGKEACLSDSASFVHEETSLFYDAIFSMDAVLEYLQTPQESKIIIIKNKKRNIEVFLRKGENWLKCSLCEGYDDLDDYNSFLQFHLQERRKWLFHNKLCYVCLSAISVTHNARNFKNRKECKICKKRHPASLHGYKAATW